MQIKYNNIITDSKYTYNDKEDTLYFNPIFDEYTVLEQYSKDKGIDIESFGELELLLMPLRKEWKQG